MVRIGLIGLGFMGMTHFEGARKVKGGKVVAIATRDRKDDVRTELARAEYESLLTRITNDSTPERDIPRLRTNRRRYLAGVAGYMRNPRYSADSRFDEMRD